MHHPSWLFPGASKNSCRQPSDAGSGDDRSTIINNNKNHNIVGFELNSFIRSLNRNGIQLPEAFMHKTGNNINNNDKNITKNARGDGNAGKSLNDFLSLMNDSVDRVLDHDTKNSSESSSFSNFRSFHERDKESAWNDLIHLVSTTAHEFRDISQTTDNESTNDTRRNISNSPASSTRILDIDTRKLLHSKVIKSRENGDKNASKESIIIGLDVTPTNDVFTRKPEVVENHSDVQSSDVKRGFLDSESLEKMCQFETPTCFFNEILRMSRGKDGFSGNSCTKTDSSAWLSSKRRTNFEDELWPIGFGAARNNDFSPYFTGTIAKPLNSRPVERDVWHNSRTRAMMNTSRSSPIFVDAGETTAETLEITVPTRDSENCEEKMHNETIISVRNNEVLANRSNGPVIIENEKKSLVASSKNEDDTRKTRSRVKLLVKRGRKIGKHTSRKNAKKRFFTETEDEEGTSGNDVNSTTSTPPISRRQSPMQRFFEESCRVRNENERLDFAENNDLIENPIRRITSKIRRSKNFTNNSSTKKCIRAIARPSEIVVSKINTSSNIQAFVAIKSPRECSKFIKNRAESNNPSSAKIDHSLVGSNQSENRRNICEKERGNNREKPIWKPAGSAKSMSSNISSVPRRSKIATLITPQLARQNVAKSLTNSSISTTRNHKISVTSNEKSQGEMPLRSAEIIFDTQASTSKQRPETFNKSSKTRIPEYSRPQIESLTRARTAKSSNSPEGTIDRDELPVNAKQERTNFNTTIPVLRSKTFVDPRRRDPNLKKIPSKENCSKNMIGKKISNRNFPQDHRQFGQSSNTHFQDCLDSRVSTETSRSDLYPGSISNFNNMPFSSNDSVMIEKIIARSVSGQASKSVEIADQETNIHEKKTREQMEPRKFYNRHERSLLMLKSILSHQGVSVDGVSRDPSGMRSKVSRESTNKPDIPISSPLERSSMPVQPGKSMTSASGTSKTLLEKLAILAECRTDRSKYADREDSCDRSFSSFANLASDSMTSCDRSMKDASEQCSIDYNESSIVSRTSITSNRSSCSKDPREEKALVSDVFTETEEDHADIICFDVALSPAPSMAEVEMKFFQAAETQTRSNVLIDKDSITEEAFRQIAGCNDNFTEMDTIDLATKEMSTDFLGPECVDATLQIDSCEITKDAISGKDFSDVRCRSRGVCFRGPPKIDGNSQVELYENSKDSASGKDYVELYAVTEEVNTDRQDYLYVDRSVNILMGPKTVDNSCQFEPQLKNVTVAVGEFSLDTRETRSWKNEELSNEKISRGVPTIETVIVKDVDVVQWKSSTTFESSRYNCGSLCSSSSSLMIHRPIVECSRGFSLEKFRHRLTDRVPREAIVALEIANERAQNLYKAIEIYRENLTARKTKKAMLLKSRESMEICLVKNNIKSERTSSRPASSKRCNFRNNSPIKSLLEGNLKRSSAPPCLEANNEMSTKLNTVDEKCPNLHEEITIVMNELLANLVRNIKTERHAGRQNDDETVVTREQFLVSRKYDNSFGREENFARHISEENVLTDEKTLLCFFLSRNSLLTFVYGTVCSLVFWALQFSITCDSL